MNYKINKFTLILLFAFFFGIFSFYANAQSTDSDTFSAKYVTPCGQLLESERENEKTAIWGVKMWLMGYITGRNQESLSKVLGDAKSESIYHHIVRYCRENPFLDVLTGVSELYKDMDFQN